VTANELAARLAAYGLAATPDGAEIEYDADAPAGLDAAAAVLTTGLLAGLTNRRWFGCRGLTGAALVLNPAARVPAGVTLMAVEGGGCWDRVFTSTRRDNPDLFDGPPPPPLPPPRPKSVMLNRPAGLSDLCLAHLDRLAAAGCAESAREATALRDYLAACDRGEVELPETPACIAAREWNAAVDELGRQQAGVGVDDRRGPHRPVQGKVKAAASSLTIPDHP